MRPSTSWSPELLTPKAPSTLSRRTPRAIAPDTTRERVGRHGGSTNATPRVGRSRRIDGAAPVSNEHSEATLASAVEQSAVSPRLDRESPVNWMLRVRTERGAGTATVREWQEAGRLNGVILRAAIDAGALDVARGAAARGRGEQLVDSESLLTLLSREVVYASQLDCPPVWRRTLPASVECSTHLKRGRRATRTRPVTAAPAGVRVQ